jgi:hypothetical protein
MFCACPTWAFVALTHLYKLRRLKNKALGVTGNFQKNTLVHDVHKAFKFPYIYVYRTKVWQRQAEVIHRNCNERVLVYIVYTVTYRWMVWLIEAWAAMDGPKKQHIFSNVAVSIPSVTDGIQRCQCLLQQTCASTRRLPRKFYAACCMSTTSGTYFSKHVTIHCCSDVQTRKM